MAQPRTYLRNSPRSAKYAIPPPTTIAIATPIHIAVLTAIDYPVHFRANA